MIQRRVKHRQEINAPSGNKCFSCSRCTTSWSSRSSLTFARENFSLSVSSFRLSSIISIGPPDWKYILSVRRKVQRNVMFAWLTFVCRFWNFECEFSSLTDSKELRSDSDLIIRRVPTARLWLNLVGGFGRFSSRWKICSDFTCSFNMEEVISWGKEQ